MVNVCASLIHLNRYHVYKLNQLFVKSAITAIDEENRITWLTCGITCGFFVQLQCKEGRETKTKDESKWQGKRGCASMQVASLSLCAIVIELLVVMSNTLWNHQPHVRHSYFARFFSFTHIFCVQHFSNFYKWRLFAIFKPKIF